MNNSKKLSLNEIKEIQIAILKFIDKTCKENNLHYSLCYGSLIGAVRHNGYIPWDDDIDIVMPRPDYEKLITLVNSDSTNIKIFDCFNNRAWYYTYAKAIDTSTIMDEHQLKPIKEYGIYVDIFPEDGLPNSEKERDRYWRKIKKIRLLTTYVHTKKAKNENSILKFFRFFLFYIFKIFPKSFWAKRINAFAKKYDYSSSEIVSVTVTGNEGRKNEMPRKIFEDFTYLDFENEKFMAVSDYDFMLKKLFDDYMKLPPEEQRISRHSFSAWRK